MPLKPKLTLSKFWLGAVLMCCCLLIHVSASAQTGFNGAYDYSTWSSTNTLGAPTQSTIDGSQQTLVLFEPNFSDEGFSGNQTFNFSHVAESSGIVSFDWSFNWDIDSCCSGFNFYVNGTMYNLADGFPGSEDGEDVGDASGTFSVAVNQGDLLSFGSYSADGCCGAANTTITDFDAGTSPVPEPPSLALVTSGLAALEVVRRKRFR
jgi:hypothetical protein